MAYDLSLGAVRALAMPEFEHRMGVILQQQGCKGFERHPSVANFMSGITIISETQHGARGCGGAAARTLVAARGGDARARRGPRGARRGPRSHHSLADHHDEAAHPRGVRRRGRHDRHPPTRLVSTSRAPRRSVASLYRTRPRPTTASSSRASRSPR